jgi:hypothetical protein
VSSPAVPWQRLTTVKIIHLSALRSSRHSLPCRILVNSFKCQLPTTNFNAISSQPPLKSSAELQSLSWAFNYLTAATRYSLNYSQLAWYPRYIASVRTHQETHFPNNLFIIACVLVTAGACSPSRCLALNIYSGSAITAFRRHITIYYHVLRILGPYMKRVVDGFLYKGCLLLWRNRRGCGPLRCAEARNSRKECD